MITYFVGKPNNPEERNKIETMILALDEVYPGQMTISEAIRVDLLPDVELILGPILADLAYKPGPFPTPESDDKPRKEIKSNLGPGCRFILASGEICDWERMKIVIREGKLLKGDVVIDSIGTHLEVKIGRGGRINLVPVGQEIKNKAKPADVQQASKAGRKKLEFEIVETHRKLSSKQLKEEMEAGEIVSGTRVKNLITGDEFYVNMTVNPDEIKYELLPSPTDD